MQLRSAPRIALWITVLPVLGALTAQRPDPLAEPFKGVTTTGTVVADPPSSGT